MNAIAFMPGEAVVATIQQGLAAYNAQRGATASQVKTRLWVFLGLFTVLVVIAAFAVISIFPGGLFSTAGWILLMFCIAGYIGVHTLALSPAKKMQQSFRDYLIPKVLSFLDNVTYVHGVKPNSFAYLPAQAIGTYNRQSFDDCIRATHEGMDFEVFEAKFSHKAGKNSATVVFRGVVLAFQLAKPFPAKLVATKAVGGFTRFMRDLFGTGGLNQVTTGDPSIDEVYEIRSDNAQWGRRLVSANFTRALDALLEAWPEAPGRVAMAAESGFVLLPTAKNLFELPEISVECDYKRHIEPMVRDLARLLDIAKLVRNAAD